MRNIANLYKKYGTEIFAGMNAVMGFLVPKQENGKIAEYTFIRSANPLSKSRPHAWIGIDSETGAVLFYKHCMHEDFIDTEKYPKDLVLSTEFPEAKTADEQALHEKKLWELYYSLREFAFKEELSEEQRLIIAKYKKQWDKTVSCDLKVYYEALSPEFFEWVSRF